jgi:gag-polypeptide of LTR copia-type
LKYQPDTGCQLTKLHKQFYASILKPGQDPDVWITSLEYICVHMETLGSEMSDANFLMYVVNNVPPEYDVIVDLLSRHIGSATDVLKIEELRLEIFDFNESKIERVVVVRLSLCLTIMVKNMLSLLVVSSKGSAILT